MVPLRAPSCSRRAPRFAVTGLLILAAMLLAGAGPAFAGHPLSPGPNRAAERLTQSLVTLNAQYHLAGPAERARRLNDLLNTAVARQQLLTSLIEANPGEVLRVALPASLRSSLPDAVRAHVEEDVEVEGELQILHQDWDSGSRLLFFLETDDGDRLSLHFAATPPAHLRSGSQVRVRGVRMGGALALSSDSTSVQTLAVTQSNAALGDHRTVVLLVNFQDNPIQPYTLEDARSAVFGTANNFYLEASFQQTWFTGDVYGWYTLPVDSTNCNGFTIRDHARQAATAAGVDLSHYTVFVYAFPWSSACGYSGMAGGLYEVWINGDLALQVVAHELGHILGLAHSHALECGPLPLGTSCETWEYGDTLDAMGNVSAGHFNAFQKERLGWLGSALATPGASGTYALDPYETPLGAHPKALKILKSVDPQTQAKTWYYVEFRQAVGFDSFLAGNGNVLSGVVIHTGSEADLNSSMLLDMTPESSWADRDWNDPALFLGQSFADPASGVTITVVSVSPTGAIVGVTVSQSACTRANPTVTLSPSQSQWVSAGTTVIYTVSVTNTDGADCAASTFTLQATAPAGWTATLTTSTLTLGPGASGSTTLTVTSPGSAPDGFFTIGVTATNGASPDYAGSTSATYVIVSSLNVTVSPNQPSYSRNQWVTLTAAVTAGGAPVANASVTFTTTKPNGGRVTGTATTGTNGVAVYTFRLKPKDPPGIYQATGEANLNSAIFGRASTNFTVR